jgi:superfamily II DNA/RNA helicase
MRFKKDDENENDFNKLHESGDENEENEVDEDDNKEDDENKTTHKTMKKELHAQKIANKKTSKKKNINLSKAINSESYTKTSLSTSTEFLQRMSYLVALVSSKKRNRSIIFFNTKSDCHKAKVILDYFKILSAEMHSDVRQTERIEALENFQNGKTHYLLATDVAGRGIDVDRVKTVINFQMPLQKERYTHRIGRTARRGNMGHAITICNDTDRQMFKKLLRDTQFDLHPLKIENDIVKSNLRELKENKYNFLEELQNDAAEKDLDRAEMKIEKNNRQSDFKDDIYNRPKK